MQWNEVIKAQDENGHDYLFQSGETGKSAASEFQESGIVTILRVTACKMHAPTPILRFHAVRLVHNYNQEMNNFFFQF